MPHSITHRLAPDESKVAMHIRMAAWHIHMAICELTGATHSYGDTTQRLPGHDGTTHPHADPRK